MFQLKCCYFPLIHNSLERGKTIKGQTNAQEQKPVQQILMVINVRLHRWKWNHFFFKLKMLNCRKLLHFYI